MRPDLRFRGRPLRWIGTLCAGLLAMATIVLVPSAAVAADIIDYMWTGAGDGHTWSQAENWNGQDSSYNTVSPAPTGPPANATVLFSNCDTSQGWSSATCVPVTATLDGTSTVDLSTIYVAPNATITISAPMTASNGNMTLDVWSDGTLNLSGANGAHNVFAFAGSTGHINFIGPASYITSGGTGPGTLSLQDATLADVDQTGPRPYDGPGYYSFTGGCGFAGLNTGDSTLRTTAQLDARDANGYIDNDFGSAFSQGGSGLVGVRSWQTGGTDYDWSIWVNGLTSGLNTTSDFRTRWATSIASLTSATAVEMQISGGDQYSSATHTHWKIDCHPDAPTGLSYARSTSGVALSWAAPANVASEAIDHYQVLRSVDGGAYSALATVTSDALTYTDATTAVGKTYSYEVESVSHTVTGDPSSALEVDPLAAPTSLAAATTTHAANLSWTAPTIPSNWTVGITGYQVCRTDVANPTPDCTDTGSTDTTYRDTSLTTGTTYQYTVAAVTALGDGLASTAVSAVPGALSAPHVSVVAGNGTAVISWTKPSSSASLSGYVVYRRSDKGLVTTSNIVTTISDPDTMSYVDPGLTNGTTYYYSVAATSGSGANLDYGTPSAPVAVTPGVNGPGGLTAVPGNRTVQLSWSAPTSGTPITGYLIYRSTDANAATPPSTPIGVEPVSTGTSYLDAGDLVDGTPQGLTNGTTYYYWVEATTDANPTVSSTGGSASAKVSATPATGQSLSLTVTPEVSPIPDEDVPLDFVTTNALTIPLTGPVTTTLTFPNSDLQKLTVVGTSGTGWSCDGGASFGALTLLTCTNSSSISPVVPGQASTYPTLVVTVHVPAGSAYGSEPIGYSVATLEQTVTSSTPLMLNVLPKETSHLDASVGPPTQLNAPSGAGDTPQADDWQNLTVEVANDGNGATLAPVTVTMPAPAGTQIGTVAVDGWTCTGTTTLTCVSDGPLNAGDQEALLLIPVVGDAQPDGSAPYAFVADVTSQDALGAIDTKAVGNAPAPSLPEPIIEPTSKRISYSTLADGQTTTSITVTDGPETATTITAPLSESSIVRLGVTNNGQADAVGDMTLVLALPAQTVASLIIADPDDPGPWTCAQDATTLTCTATAQTVAIGASLTGPTVVVSPVTDVPILAPVAFQGSLFAVFNGAQSAPAIVDLSTPGGVASPDVSTQATVEDSPLTSNFPSSVTFSLVGPTGTTPATRQTFALLAPPQVTLDPSSLTVVDASTTQSAGTDPGDQLTAYPADYALPTCQAVTPSSSSFPGGATTAIICVGDSLVPAKSRVDVTVDFTAGPNIAGDVIFTTGTLAALTGNDAARQTAAASLLNDSGPSALGASFTLVAKGVAISAVAGNAQTVADATPDSGGIMRATRVSLDATGTSQIGRPLSYEWVQTSGPSAAWANAPPDTPDFTPGHGDNPAFPAHDASGATIPAAGGVGQQPAFSAPVVTSTTTLTFKLYVTDGYAVSTATTTVTLNPVADTAPTIDVPSITLTQADGTTPISSTTTPAAGTVVQIHVPYRDIDVDPVAITASVITPSELPALAIRVLSAGTTDVATATGTAVLQFTWPSGVTGLLWGFNATDGHVNPSGQAIAGHASFGIGAALPALTSTLTAADGDGNAITAPVPAGSTATLTDTLTNDTALGTTTAVSWSQASGPTGTITPAAGGRTATFTLPTTAHAGDVVTLRTIARRGSGTMSDVVTSTISLTVSATAPLSIASVTIPDTSTLTLHGSAAITGSITGGVAPYTYSWQVTSGTDTITANTPAHGTYTGSTAATVAAMSTPGPETLQLTVTDAVGNTTTQTGILTVPGPTPDQVACDGATVLGTLFGAAAADSASDHVIFSYGPATLDLGTKGSVIGSATCSAGTRLTLTGASLTYQGIGLTGLHGSLTKTGITITSANVNVPSSWHLGTVTMKNLAYDWTSNALTGSLTATSLPLLGSVTAVSNPTTTITLTASLLTISSTAGLTSGSGAGSVTVHAAYCFSTTVCAAANSEVGDVQPGEIAGGVTVSGLSFLGGTAAGSGVLRRSATGAASGSVHLTWTKPGGGVSVGPVSVTSAGFDWTPDGLGFSIAGTVGSNVSVSLAGTYSDSTHWSANAAGGLTSAWTPAAGFTLPAWNGTTGAGATGTYLTGTAANAGSGVTATLLLNAPMTWTAGPLTISGLKVQIGKGTDAPTTCSLTADQKAGSYLDVTGSGTVTVSTSTSVTVNTEVCVIPGVSWKTISSATASSPIQVTSGLTLSSVQLTASKNGSATNVVLSGQGTAYGATGGASVDIEKSGGTTDVVAALTVDLSSVTSALKGQGDLIYTTKDISDLSQYSDLNLGFASSAPTVTPSCGSGTPTVNGVEVPAGFTALGSFTLSQSACSFLSTKLGFQAAGSVLAVASIGHAATTVTLSLDAGPNGITMFKDSDGTALTLTSAHLKVSSAGTFSIGADAQLTMPEPTDATQMTTLDLSAGVELDIVHPGATISLSMSGGTWHDAFGVTGLDLASLDFSAGVSFVGVPTPTVGIAATVTNLPTDVMHSLGIQSTGGAMNEPVSFALNISTSNPIFAISLGTADGNTFIKPLEPISASLADDLTIDDASLVIAPTGGTIGKTTFAPGYSLRFDTAIIGTAVHVDAAFDPTAGSIDATVDIGAFNAGPVALKDTSLHVAVSPTDGLDFAFTGGFTWKSGVSLVNGRPTATTSSVQATVAVSAGPDKPLNLHFGATLQNYTVYTGVVLTQLNLMADASLGDVGDAANHITLAALANTSILGHPVLVGGSLSITSQGIQSFNLVAATTPISVGGLSISGGGCDATMLSALPSGVTAGMTFPTSGPCIQIAYSPNSTSGRITGSITTPVGLSATIDASISSSALYISDGTVQVASGVTVSIKNSKFVWGDHSGLLIFDATSRRTVAASAGDFDLEGSAAVNLAGFNGTLVVSVGHVGTDAWGTGSMYLSLFSSESSPIISNVALSGSFSHDSDGFHWSLAGNALLRIRAGGDFYDLANAAFALDSAGNLAVSGSLNAGGIVQATVAGNVTVTHGIQFDFHATGTMKVLGATAAAVVDLTNITPNGAVKASIAVNTTLGSIITVNASATFLTTGAFCINGAVNVGSGIASAAAVICTPGVPGQKAGVKATLNVLDLASVGLNVTDVNHYVAWARVDLPSLGFNAEYCSWWSGCWGAAAGFSGHFMAAFASNAQDINTGAGGIVHVNAGVSLLAQASIWGEVCAVDCARASLGVTIGFNPTSFCASILGSNFCYRPPSSFS